jgi:hypothetical protein
MNFRGFLRQLRFGTDLPYRLYDRVALLLRQFAPHHPLRREADDARTPPFFIVGSGRSGNTLLRALLVGHGELAIPPESYVLGMAVRDYRRFSFLPWKELLRIVLGRFQFYPHFGTWQMDLRRVYEELEACPEQERSLARLLDTVYRSWATRHRLHPSRWGDKTPINVYHLPRIHAVFPEATYIHMLRDGRDVVASYLNAGLYDSAGKACTRWVESVKLVRRFGRRLPPEHHLQVRYEDLVRDPETITRRVCAHLGISFDPRMLRHRDRVEDMGDTDLSHHSNLWSPISRRSVGSWRHRLDPRQQELVEDRLCALLTELDYLG